MTNVYFLKPQGIKSNSITDLKRKQQFYPSNLLPANQAAFKGYQPNFNNPVIFN